MFPHHIHDPADADGRLIVCLPVAGNPLPPGPGASYGDCNVCGWQVWMGPHARSLMVEFDHLGLDYEIRCKPHADHGIENNDLCFADPGDEADRLRMLRGELPRHDFVFVCEADLPAIRNHFDIESWPRG